MSDDSQFLVRVRSIPAGRVTTYGDLCPGAPRRAGALLAACEDPAVPWQRVVRADGSLAKGEHQRALLEAEGVPFRGRRVDMSAAWVPPSVSYPQPMGPCSRLTPVSQVLIRRL